MPATTIALPTGPRRYAFGCDQATVRRRTDPIVTMHARRGQHQLPTHRGGVTRFICPVGGMATGLHGHDRLRHGDRGLHGLRESSARGAGTTAWPMLGAIPNFGVIAVEADAAVVPRGNGGRHLLSGVTRSLTTHEQPASEGSSATDTVVMRQGSSSASNGDTYNDFQRHGRREDGSRSWTRRPNGDGVYERDQRHACGRTQRLIR